MTYLLDTNMVSYIVKGRSRAAIDRLLALSGGDVAAVSSVTVAEVRYGLARKSGPTALPFLMNSFFASIQVLAWGLEEAEAYGTLRASLEKKGLPLGSLDTLIAAHAAALGATLVTNDKAFTQVAELKAIVNWATDLEATGSQKS